MNIVKNKNNFTLIFIVFLTSFLLGVIFSFKLGIKINNELLKSSWNDSVVKLLYNSNSKSNINFDKLWEVYKLITSEYYDIDWIKNDELVDNAIKWLVDWLWDKHSQFMTLDESNQFNKMLSWDFEWIWAVVNKNPLWVAIERLIKGSPAIKYWLKAKDLIIKANWVSLEWLDLYDAVDKIKWPAWTEVVLDILRSWEKEVLTIKVIRGKIKIPSVNDELFKKEDIWYISINMFWLDTADQFKNALNKYKDKKWIIIDLRDNWGWYLQSAVEILSNLIENDKTVVVTKYKDLFSNEKYTSINDGNIYNWKIVLLINENSASASEITSWALRDYNKAILVWKKSYWKWSVQKPFYLSDWSMVKLTIAKWFTPNDINIDHEWINPDIEVSFKKEDYTPEKWKEDEFVPYDRQLEVAKKVLLEFIKTKALQLTVDNFKKEYDLNNTWSLDK